MPRNQPVNDPPESSFDLDMPTDEELNREMTQREEEQAQNTAGEESSAATGRINKTSHELLSDDILHEAQRARRQDSAFIIGRLNNALKRNDVLSSKIAKVEPGTDTAYWVCYEGPVTIRIPCAETFVNLPENLQREGRGSVNDKVNFLTKNIGATISYVLTSLNGYEATASRRLALNRISSRYFGRGAPNPVKVGDVVDATVMAAGNHAAFLNVLGVDVRIGKPDITYRYIPLVSELYGAGDTIKVKVMDIQYGSTAIPTLTVSGKAVEEEEFSLYYSRVTPGHNCIATVKSVTLQRNDTKLYITLFLDDIGLPAFSSSTLLSLRDKLHTGDKVVFRMNGISESGMVHGAITRIINR